MAGFRFYTERRKSSPSMAYDAQELVMRCIRRVFAEETTDGHRWTLIFRGRSFGR
jgi:hypothetical protein